MTRPFSVAWSAAAVLSALILYAAPAEAQNVVLNPATIQGTLDVTGQTLDNAWVSASWTDNSTSPPTTYSASTSVSGNTYSLIVNVPQGTTPTYTVYAYGYIHGSNQQFSFDPQTVNPDPASPQTLNFAVNPGIIQGTVTVTGETLNYFYVFAGSNYSYFPGTPGTYSLVVNPGTQIYVWAFGGGQFGGATFTPSYQYVDVNAGETVTVDWAASVPSAPPQGSIAGTVTLTGSIAPTSLYVNASGPSSGSSSATPTFSMPNLYAGSYTMYGSASFANNSYLSFPDSMFSPSRNVTVSGGATTVVDISGTENFLNGSVKLGGTNTLADTSYASFNVSGVYGTTAAGGNSGINLPSNGEVSLVLTDGSWAPSSLYVTFSKVSDPANYLYEQLYFYDYEQANNPVVLSGGQTVTKNLLYAMGKVTVNFKALGNATFSSPQLYASCYELDPLTSQAKWSYSAYAYNYSLNNVTEGGVTFAGMAGNCQIQASAYVNGSNYVTFGTLNVTVVPGVIIIVDIFGPSLHVTSPAADSISPTPSVTVTGTADDDAVAIAGITVNGVTAAIVSTNNPAHEHEVSFSATVPLVPGANTLTTVVTAEDTDDEPGKQASDSRTVFYKVAPAVTATGGTFTYDGSPHAGSGSATGANGALPVTLSYSGTGSTTYGPTSDAPSNVGTYQVVAHTDGDDATLSGDSNPASLIITDVASYAVCGIQMPKGPRQSGSTIPVKLQVCDGNGVNISSSSIVVHATDIQLVSGTENGTLQDSGNANPGMNFRLVGPPAMYMFNLQTTGFKAGTYNLLFTIGSDPTVQSVSFQIR